VELAQLKYLAARLVGQGIDMGQQKFAVGARGPGETKLELDRRKLDKRVHLLKERLEKLKHQRQVQTQGRRSLSPGIIEFEAPMDISNVMLVCPACKKTTRVGVKREGETVQRVCKECNALFD